MWTLDGNNFTFNGIGEYILVHTPATKGLDVQARLERLSSNVTGTVMTNIVVKLGDLPGIQVEAGTEQLNIYIDGIQHPLRVGDSPIIITSLGILSSNLTGGIGGIDDPMMMTTMDQLIVLRMESTNSLVVGIGEGGSIVISLQTSFLILSMALPEGYRNQTSGLLGVLNDKPDDDFIDRNGTILDLSTEEEIYEEFGLMCKLVPEY